MSTSADLRLWFTGLFRFHCYASFESCSERNLNYANVVNLFVLSNDKN